jgi:hypothetical protein
MIDAIADCCEQHVGKRLEAINIKHHKMFEYWDDIAVQVETNTGYTLYDDDKAEMAALRGAP